MPVDQSAVDVTKGLRIVAVGAYQGLDAGPAGSHFLRIEQRADDLLGQRGGAAIPVLAKLSEAFSTLGALRSLSWPPTPIERARPSVP